MTIAFPTFGFGHLALSRPYKVVYQEIGSSCPTLAIVTNALICCRTPLAMATMGLITNCGGAIVQGWREIIKINCFIDQKWEYELEL